MDAVINIKVSGQFYNDLKLVFNNFLMEDESQEQVSQILDNLVNQRITSAKEHRLYMLYILIANIEIEAKEQNVIEYKTLEEITSGSGS